MLNGRYCELVFNQDSCEVSFTIVAASEDIVFINDCIERR